MTRSVVHAAVLAVVLCLLSGCTAVDPPLGFPYGLVRIWLKDEVSGERITGASIVASNGSYTTYLLELAPWGGEYAGGYREGVYRLEITAAGYQPLEVDGIVVEEINGRIYAGQEFLTMTPE